MRTFKIEPNPYDEVDIFTGGDLTIEEGVTVLVGCNGYGKTTLMCEMMRRLKEEGIKYHKHFDIDTVDELNWKARLDDAVMLDCVKNGFRSEGEKVANRLNMLCKDIGTYVYQKSGDEAWVFFDSLDSGVSIDEVNEIQKTLLKTMVEDKPKGKELYIVISTNVYEFTRNHFLPKDKYRCIDTCTFETKEFKDYEDYRFYINRTRKTKDRRYE